MKTKMIKGYSIVHIYSEEEISVDGFVATCKNWYTSTAKLDYTAARRLSRKTDKPVLYFYCRTSLDFNLIVFINGKMEVVYSNDGITQNKGIFKLPAIVGYAEGNKRRLSSILDCKDTDLKVAMLEEFLGVGLVRNDPSVQKGEVLYKKYMQQHKLFTGKNARIQKELVSETDGKIFHNTFASGMERFRKPHIFLYGFDKDYDSMGAERIFQWLEFENGKLSPISEERLSQVEYVEKHKHDTFRRESKQVHFNEKAPASRTFDVPETLSPFGFYDDNIFILTNDNSTLYFVDASFQFVAKQNFKGCPIDCRDGHILTCGSTSFYAYMYNPSDKIRIYRLYENK